jgi:shikimate 5-dehydrogenase
VSRPRVLFVGISTGGSLVHRVFPRWAESLGIDAALEGVDLPAATPDRVYRALAERIRDDGDVLGAVITSHKLGMHRAARGLLDAADPYVDALGEINTIAVRGGAATAHARDPLAIAGVLPGITGGRLPREVLCLGAGGAGLALLVSLLVERDGAALRPRAAVPQRIVMSDARADRRQAVETLLRALPTTPADVAAVPAQHNDAALAALGDGALVVNATGLGKDAPGSPVASHARFPRGAVVWDANYRGALGFLATARAQAERRALRVHDGWSYFVQGWAQALGPIFGVSVDDALCARLAAAAAPLRPRA